MQDLIDKYKFFPHPEGGYYAVVYESKHSVTSPVVNKVRKALTHICFLLLKGQVSIFHKVAHDEIWNFYQGDPLKLIKYNGSKVEEDIIGSGCSVAPGFEFEDFLFLRDELDTKEKFIQKFPGYQKFV